MLSYADITSSDAYGDEVKKEIASRQDKLTYRDIAGRLARVRRADAEKNRKDKALIRAFLIIFRRSPQISEAINIALFINLLCKQGR